MQPLLFIGLFVLQASICWSDFRTRTIAVWQVSLLFLFSVVWGLYFYGLSEFGKGIFFNVSWLIVQAAFVWVYFKLLRKKKAVLDKMIGSGDILFLVAIAPLFTFPVFIVFYISGMALSLLGHITVSTLFDNTGPIPLAGWLAVWCIVFLALDFFGLFSKYEILELWSY